MKPWKDLNGNPIPPSRVAALKAQAKRIARRHSRDSRVFRPKSIKVMYGDQVLAHLTLDGQGSILTVACVDDLDVNLEAAQ